jgi:hypothetical protein
MNRLSSVADASRSDSADPAKVDVGDTGGSSARGRRWLMMGALAAFGGVLGMPARDSWTSLLQAPEFQLERRDIQISQPPRWIPGDLVREIVSNCDLPRRISLMDPNITRELHDACALNPWVERVHTVHKTFPPRVTIELDYRRPMALVCIESGEFHVDESGILLPQPRQILTDLASFPRIEGIRTAPGLVGHPWGDPLVTNASSLAAILEPFWKELQLTAIVVPSTNHRPDSFDDGVFELRAVDGSRILWGHPPESDHPGSLPTQTRLQRLRDYNRQLGPFGGQHGAHLIDLRPLGEISRRPLGLPRPPQPTDTN